MGTFTLWRHAADKGELRRVTWVCGEQRVLVEEVVDTVRALAQPGPLDCVSLTAGTVPDRDLWAAASLYPVGERRLVLIREAQRITRFGPLLDWLGNLRALPGVYLLLVSDEHDLPTAKVDGKTQPADYVEAMRAPRGHLVRCSALNQSDAIAWVQRRAALDQETALHLLRRTGGDLGRAGAVCAKLALFDGQPSMQAIDALVAQAPEEFVEALLHLRRTEAVHAAESVPERDYPAIIGLLDLRLDLMAVLWRANRAGLRSREIHGEPQWLVQRYLPAAKHYEPERIDRMRHVLAVLDDAVRTGARAGVLEALTALW
jgi:DNA polymerase III delta subunit